MQHTPRGLTPPPHPLALPGDLWRILWRAQRGPIALPLTAYGWLEPLARTGWLGCVRAHADTQRGLLHLAPWPQARARPGLQMHVWDFPVAPGTLALAHAWARLGSPGADPLEQVERWAQAHMPWGARAASLRPWRGRALSVRVRVWGPHGMRPQPNGILRLEAGVRLRRAAALPAYARTEAWRGQRAEARLRKTLSSAYPARLAAGLAHDLMAEHRTLARRMRAARLAHQAPPTRPHAPNKPPDPCPTTS